MITPSLISILYINIYIYRHRDIRFTSHRNKNTESEMKTSNSFYLMPESRIIQTSKLVVQELEGGEFGGAIIE